MKRIRTFVLTALVLGCSGGSELAGEWEMVDPDTGSAVGPVLVIDSDGSWTQSGTPSYAGSYTWDSGKLLLRVDELNGDSREEAMTQAVAAGQPKEMAEKSLEALDERMRFELDSQEGSVYLRQIEPDPNTPQLIFKKREVTD